MSADWMVGLIAAIGSLVLVGAGLRGRGLSFDKTLSMALAWAAIIGGLALVATWLDA